MNDILIPEYVRVLMQRLHSRGFEAYIVGGCVRDSVLGIVPHDFDITTNALPEQMLEAFFDMRVIETGLKHGTLTVLSEGNPIEITTYRIDGEYSDGRRPDGVVFTRSIKEDAARRDFTVNALAYSDDEGIVDFFGGINDLKNETIRCVGEPEKRFSEDALRIMRALRFSSTLGFDIDAETKKAIFSMKDRLLGISAERISSELEKLLMGKNCYSILSEYAEVLGVIVPEILPCIDFDQKNRYHRYTVWEHIAVSVAVSRRERLVRLAMFLHDIGKPKCFTVDGSGQGHFHGHEKISAEMTEIILHRLKFDTDTIKAVTRLVAKHYFKPETDENGNVREKQVKRLLSEMGEDFFLLLDVSRADNSAKEGFCLERLGTLDKMEAAARKMLLDNECLSLRQLEIDGNDVASLGFKGAEIGAALKKALAAVLDGSVENDKEMLLSYLTNKNN